MSAEPSRLEFIGQLAGGLAHEIKNPLSTMRLHLELMQEDFQGKPDDLSKRHLRKTEMLLKEIRRLEEIVQEFLRISRGHDLKLAAVSLTRSLEELVELVRPEAEAENVVLHLRIQSDLGTVLVDENYLHRALLNIVQNAIQACKPKGGGSVIIEAGRARNAVGIAIIDTGIGIPDEIKDRVFRAYFTTRPGGTGMGLPMARRIIEEHGGYLAFDSVPGQGTRFMVMLPVSTAETLNQMVLSREQSSFSGRHAPVTSDSNGDEVVIDVPAAVNQVLAESKKRSHVAGGSGEG